MSILIKNIHCIKALVNRNPEMIISLKADSKKELSKLSKKLAPEIVKLLIY